MHFSVAQWPNSGLGRLIVKVSRSHTIRHTHTQLHTIGLLWISDQLVAEAATYSTQSINIPDKYPFPQRDSNLLPQQTRGFRSMPYITRGR